MEKCLKVQEAQGLTVGDEWTGMMRMFQGPALKLRLLFHFAWRFGLGYLVPGR